MAERCLTYDGAAGAAFLMKEQARHSIVLHRSGGTVRIREGAPYLTVSFCATPDSRDSLPTVAWRVAQEALDVYAATHRIAMATRRREYEWISWLRGDAGYQLIIADTTNIPWEMGGSGTTGSGADTADNSVIEHHLSLRFHRLSLVTDDLFDAFRNAYLSLECLVSDESPKLGDEGEVAWLKRVLGGALSAGVPHGMNADEIVDAIYRDGRLPLFHAKMQKDFYVGHDAEREQVRDLLGKLRILLSSLFTHKYDRRFAGGWGTMMEVGRDAMLRATLQFDEVAYLLKSERELCVSKLEVQENGRKFGNLSTNVGVAPPAELKFVDVIELRKGGAKIWTLNFLEPLPMKQVANVNIALSFSMGNTRAPKTVHST